MSNDRVPLKKFESPYGGDVVPPRCCRRHSSGYGSSCACPACRWTSVSAGESSEREYPCATQSRHRPIDIYKLPDCLPDNVVEGDPFGPEAIEPLALLVRDNADPAGQHLITQNTVVEVGPAGPEVIEPLELLVRDRPDPTGKNTVVEVGPAGPEVIEPLELLVLDRVDPAGQHAVIRDTTRWLEHPLARPESSLRDGLVEKISDGEPAARQVPDITLYSRPMEGIPYLEHLAPGTVDPWMGCRTWNYWSSRFFIHGGLHNLRNVL